MPDKKPTKRDDLRQADETPDHLAPIAPEEDPTVCPLCGAPAWTKLYARKDSRGLQIRFECESSALIRGGRIWAPAFESQSYACAYLAKQRDEIARLRGTAQ